jgi:hypothetical protein
MEPIGIFFRSKFRKDIADFYVNFQMMNTISQRHCRFSKEKDA